ncbi:MAG: hypothetical protein HYW01_10360 [Deltaproteobacteria bacterium]|nr:hypothetical protein [Deltaproteobacteria bacterium]
MGKDKRGFVYLKTSVVVSLVILAALFIPIKGVKAAGPSLPYSFFLEHPYSITGVRGNFEIIDLDGSGGLFMNQIRADINVYQNLFGIYAKFPFAGVTNFGPDEEDDYDFGNIGIGGKVALLNTDSAVLTGGFEVILPTTSNDFGSAAARAYFRDFSYFVDDALTLKPYAVFGYSQGIFGFQANFDADIITNADEIEDDSTELILKYGATASVTPNLSLPFSTSFLLELLMASSTSFDDNITGAYLTPGVRFGGQILSLGAGVQIPFGSDEVTDFANVGFLLDLVIRFGS